MNKFNRPSGMSQLDYLWVNFGSRTILDGTQSDPDGLVTGAALDEALKKCTGGGITDLKLAPKPGDNTKLELAGIGPTGELLSLVEFDKEDHITGLGLINSTQVEVDNEVCENIDEPLLVITMMSGQKFYQSLTQFKYTGVETNSIKTQVNGSRIAAHLKIDESIETPLVDVKVTNDGLKVDLLLKDPEQGSQLKLVRTSDGLDTKYTWDDGNNILFQCLTFNEYKLLEKKESGKIYFIPDAMCIYLNGIRYGDNLSLQDTDTIQMINNSNVISLEVKIDPDNNLIKKSKAGLTANIYWEE